MTRSRPLRIYRLKRELPMFYVCLFFTCLVSLSISSNGLKRALLLLAGSLRADNRNGCCRCTRDSDSFSLSLFPEGSPPHLNLDTKPSVGLAKAIPWRTRETQSSAIDVTFTSHLLPSSPSSTFRFFIRFFEEERNYSVIHIQKRDYGNSRPEVDGKCMTRCVVIHSKCKALRCIYIHVSASLFSFPPENRKQRI